MKKIHVAPVSRMRKRLSVQGDKSISHRAIIIGSLAKGKTEISNFLEAEDTLNTIKVYKQLGVKIEKKKGKYYVFGRGLNSFRQPIKQLYVGNSGTGIRLTLGVLAPQNFNCSITGDGQIVKRPMNRVILPLTLMGAKFKSNNGYAPVTVTGGPLRGIKYEMPVASAQVKSALMFAALHASGKTEICEKIKSRDHTERMLKYFGADIREKKGMLTITPGSALKGKKVFVPGDISSAAYFMAAGTLVKPASLTVKNVGINDSRTGIIDAMKKMGAKISVKNRKLKNGEPVADIAVAGSKLKGITIGGAIIPRLIDEIPVIAVMAAFAAGKTVIKDAKELRVKETDRIATVVENLRRIGVKAEERADGMIIHGRAGRAFTYADIDSYGDHRIAMSFSVAALVSENGLLIKDIECVNTSFPEFFSIVEDLK